ncbi:MAG: hypothetical protein GY896_03710 [Gammaproteobacteria bacterium]|nr:hypothetical protein [Gammaproteobacteria bacterium]
MFEKIECLSQVCVAALLLGLPSTGLSATPVLPGSETTVYEGARWTIGVGYGLVEFDTNVKVTNKQTGRSRYVDFEGNLDLPEYSEVQTFYGAYRFNRKHSLLFGYFEIDRDSTLLNISQNFDDIVIIDARVTLSDNSRFYNISYGYNLFRDDRSNVTFAIGLNSLDLKLKAEASGQLTVGGITRSEAELAEASVIAPLPLLGLNFGFDFTPKWSISTRISLVGGSYNEVSAGVIQTSINSLYRFSEHSGFLLGMTYFDANVEIDDDDELSDVSYGYTGLFMGLHFGF